LITSVGNVQLQKTANGHSPAKTILTDIFPNQDVKKTDPKKAGSAV